MSGSRERYAETGLGDVRRLQAMNAGWRLRVGGWRVLFELDGRANRMTVQRVLPRGRAYRR